MGQCILGDSRLPLLRCFERCDWQSGRSSHPSSRHQCTPADTESKTWKLHQGEELYLALQGCPVPLHLLPALAHTLLTLLGPEAQCIDVPVLAEGVAQASRSLNL